MNKVKLVLVRDDLTALRFANQFDLEKISDDTLLMESKIVPKVIEYLLRRGMKFGVFNEISEFGKKI